jgi:peptidyl-prolyl cis-trans isomerase D
MGNDFIEVAKEVTNFDQEALELGDLTRGELTIKELGDAAFSLDVGNYTVPIRSSLGWHILRVTNITPATKKALGEVRNGLKRSIQLDLAADSLITLSNQIEDELGAGASIRDAAARLNLRVENIPAIDNQGLNELGKAIDGISDQKEILNAVFATSEGEDSDLNDYGSSNFFILHVEKVTKPTLRPLDKIINDVRMAWKHDHRAEEAENKAKNLVNELNNGISPKILASKLKVDLLSTRPFTRSGEGLKRELPRELISKVFASKVRSSVLAAGNGVHLVAFVSEKRHPITANRSKLAEAIRVQLSENFLGDLKKQLAEALRKRLGVTINRENIKQIFSKTNTP